MRLRMIMVVHSGGAGGGGGGGEGGGVADLRRGLGKKEWGVFSRGEG